MNCYRRSCDQRLGPHHLGPIPPPCLLILSPYSDLGLGSIYYRKLINVASGWVHHTAYTIFFLYWAHRGWSHLAAMASIFEVSQMVEISCQLSSFKFDYSLSLCLSSFSCSLIIVSLPFSTKTAADSGNGSCKSSSTPSFQHGFHNHLLRN